MIHLQERRSVWPPLASLLLFAAAAAAAEEPGRTPDHDYDAPAAGSYTLPAIRPAAAGPVVDSRGERLDLRNLTRGRVTVLSFIYSSCAVAEACPYATGVLLNLHQLSEEDPALAKGMRLVSMSFDPETDTPERMAAYEALTQTEGPAAEWHFLTTRSQAELGPILDGYGQAVDKRKDPNAPQGPLYHVLRVYLIDANGIIRNIYSTGTLDVRLVLADVKTLLMEASSS